MSDSLPSHAVLFADISGSSRLYKTLGNEQAKQYIDDSLALMSALTIVHEGVVVKTIGDEILAKFSNAIDACETACAIQQRFQPKSRQDLPLIRIGISYGPTLVTANDIFGETVNDAAFVTQIAGTGQIVLTESVINTLPNDYLSRCQLFDHIHIKGDQKSTAIYRLLWEQNSHKHLATQLMPHHATENSRTTTITLSFKGQSFQLAPTDLPFAIGREMVDRGLLIDHPLASRHHCSIDFHRGKFILIDHSTNGTYVTQEYQKQIYARRETFPLQNHGKIAIGQSTEQAGDWNIIYAINEESHEEY